MSKMPFVPKGSISDQKLSIVYATEGRTVRVNAAGVSESLASYLNDLSARLRAQDDRIAAMEREIEALKPKPLEYTSDSVAAKTQTDLKVQQ